MIFLFRHFSGAHSNAVHVGDIIIGKETLHLGSFYTPYTPQGYF
jgi:hypothetical protein